MNNSLAFDTILNFLADLSEAFSNSSASKYYDFVQAITVADKKEKEKHVNLFKAFCIANRTEILEGKFNSFKLHKICYDDTEEPFDIQEIFDHPDFKDNSADILKHLLTISAIVDEESNAKQILSSMEKTNLFKDPSITNLFGEITKDIELKEDGSVDPMSTIEGIVKADAFKQLVSSIVQKTQKGEIDIGSLLTGMSGMGKLLDAQKRS